MADLKIIGKPHGIEEKWLDFINDKIFSSISQLQMGFEPECFAEVICDNRSFTIPANFINDKDKVLFGLIVYALCKKSNAKYVITLLDVFMVKTTFENFKKEEFIRPSEDPERFESLVVTIHFPDGKNQSIIIPYERQQEFKITTENLKWDITAMEYTGGIIKPWK